MVEQFLRDIIPLVELKNYNVVINGRNFFDQQVKNNLITYGNTQKIATAQRDYYRTVCLLY